MVYEVGLTGRHVVGVEDSSVSHSEQIEFLFVLDWILLIKIQSPLSHVEYAQSNLTFLADGGFSSV